MASVRLLTDVLYCRDICLTVVVSYACELISLLCVAFCLVQLYVLFVVD